VNLPCRAQETVRLALVKRAIFSVVFEESLCIIRIS
jgi:hypothetical protein